MKWIAVPYTKYAVIRDTDCNSGLDRACAYNLSEKEAEELAERLNTFGYGLEVPEIPSEPI